MLVIHGNSYTILGLLARNLLVVERVCTSQCNLVAVSFSG